MKKVTHTGSRFDDFLAEDGLLAEVEAVAIKRVLAWQLAEAMKARKLTKDAMARKMKTSRSQLDRLLDPEAASVTLSTMTRAATALGKKLTFKLVNA
jgi:antitoxin HicB